MIKLYHCKKNNNRNERDNRDLTITFIVLDHSIFITKKELQGPIISRFNVNIEIKSPKNKMI